MYDFLRRSTNPEISDLVEVIRQIRRRWRFKLALRGVVLVAAFVVAALVGAAFGLESRTVAWSRATRRTVRCTRARTRAAND